MSTDHDHRHQHGSYSHSHDHKEGDSHSHGQDASVPNSPNNPNDPAWHWPRPGIRKRMHTPALYIPPQYPEMLQRLQAKAKKELGDEFLGITSEGILLPGLFPVTKTGVTVTPMAEAAGALLALLDHAQQQKACFDVQSEQWRAWCNIHPFISRHGIGLHELTPAQRGAALNLVGTALSASGFETARNVMRLNEHCLEITGLPEEYNEWYYWLSLFGPPSPSEPWGWQLDGHHLILNCLVLGDQIVFTPQFLGSEPVFAQFGKYAGTHVFRPEEASGLAMMRALSPDQQAKATISTALPGEVFAPAFSDNLRIQFEGIRYDELSAVQQQNLRDLIRIYTERLRPGHAQIRFGEICDHLRDTYFAWIGSTEDRNPFYYRIYNPVVLIEFDHQPGVVYENSVPTRDHIHTVVRTPNGNDYGRDLLRQHYAQHDHSREDSVHRRGQE